MRKIFVWSLMLILTLSLIGCTEKIPSSEKRSSESVDEASNNKEAGGSEDDKLTLPDSYPNEILPLAADAEIIDIRENPGNRGLEVDYVSGNNIDTLCDYYEGALKDANDLDTSKVENGYRISANMDGVYYTIMLSEWIMDHLPQYKDKVVVSIILTGLKDIPSEKSKLPEGTGEQWPNDELSGVPPLTGYIDKIQREDDIVRLEIIVADVSVVTRYIEELKKAGFSPDTDPEVQNNHVEFLAFKESSMINFAYKGEEQRVFIEYQK